MHSLNLMSIFIRFTNICALHSTQQIHLKYQRNFFSFLSCFCGKIHSARNDLQLTAGNLIYWKIKNTISSNLIPQRCTLIEAKCSYLNITFAKNHFYSCLQNKRVKKYFKKRFKPRWRCDLIYEIIVYLF